MLTTKESEFLKDLKAQEQLCIDKYTKHSDCAKDVQLRNLFKNAAENEKTHLQWLGEIEKGNVPNTGSASMGNPTFSPTYNATPTPEKENDAYLCKDLLASEKHASTLYDTCVFEFTNEGMRNVLNTIQKQEQNHGKQLFDYMSVNSITC